MKELKKQFAMQQVLEILLRKPSDKSIIAYLDNTTTSGLENTATMTYATGGRGHVYIGSGFSHSKRATFNVATATFNSEVLATQNGTELYVGKTEVTEYDIMEAVAGVYKTKFKAIGAADSEIGYVYEVLADGTTGTVFTQTTGTATAGTFVYDPATQAISLFADDLVALAGAKLVCTYTRETEGNAQVVHVSGDSIPAKVLVSAYGYASDICSEEFYPCVIEGMAVIDQNYSFDLSSDGDPAIHSLNMEFVRGCGVSDLYTFTIYTDEVPAPTP